MKIYGRMFISLLVGRRPLPARGKHNDMGFVCDVTFTILELCLD